MADGHASFSTWHLNSWNYTLSSDKKQGTALISGILTYPSYPTINVSNTNTWVADTEL
ncbi:MAG: hypothetical protein JWR72_1752 [Flavisolibacter sp.]|jgi:hypothetical protein|nr:hypothetical protein [Flavisolibacter sp.]